MKFKKGDKVVFAGLKLCGGPQHMIEGKTYTVSKSNKDYVYIKEIYSGRYGFYLNRWVKK